MARCTKCGYVLGGSGLGGCYCESVSPPDPSLKGASGPFYVECCYYSDVWKVHSMEGMKYYIPHGWRLVKKDETTSAGDLFLNFQRYNERNPELTCDIGAKCWTDPQLLYSGPWTSYEPLIRKI